MRGRCPHCGEVNEYTRAPTTAIVYCQYCRKPFGAAALSRDPAEKGNGRDAQTGAPRRRAASGPLPSPSLSLGRRPPAPRPAASIDDTRPPIRNEKTEPVAARVIVPKLGPKGKSEGHVTRAKLIYRGVEGLETEFDLGDIGTVGRHPKNSIRLHDREVSKEHAVIEKRPEGYFIRDLNSSNGTYVNNRRIRETQLKAGDELMFGSMQLKFTLVDEAQEEEKKDDRDLVTILPTEPQGSTHVHATLDDRPEERDFRPAVEVHDVEALKNDYEKLRFAYELSRAGISMDFAAFLKRTLQVAFDLLPADNGVILLVDPETGVLLPHTVKRRESDQPQEIVLSSTIVNQVIEGRKSCLLSDAFLDPRFSTAQSIISQGIRSAMCVPLVANDTVYGVMHLDSRQRIGAFTEKDLSLLKALANQAAIAIANSRLIRKIEDDAKTTAQLSRFLPDHVVSEMVQGRGEAITKGGRECNATVLFCDIRGFTMMSEQQGPQDIVDLLNEYFEILVEVVFRRHGVLDKFIGDAMMAHWGTIPVEEDEDPALAAVSAALELRDAIRQFNDDRVAEGKPPVGMGVGINSGRLVAGYMGAKRRLEYTVIGDTVNTASRICGLAAADQVLLSESTYRLVESRVEGHYLGTKQVKGKEQGVEVYEAVGLIGAGSFSETGS